MPVTFHDPEPPDYSPDIDLALSTNLGWRDGDRFYGFIQLGNGTSHLSAFDLQDDDSLEHVFTTPNLTLSGSDAGGYSFHGGFSGHFDGSMYVYRDGAIYRRSLDPSNGALGSDEQVVDVAAEFSLDMEDGNVASRAWASFDDNHLIVLSVWESAGSRLCALCIGPGGTLLWSETFFELSGAPLYFSESAPGIKREPGTSRFAMAVTHNGSGATDGVYAVVLDASAREGLDLKVDEDRSFLAETMAVAWTGAGRLIFVVSMSDWYFLSEENPPRVVGIRVGPSSMTATGESTFPRVGVLPDSTDEFDVYEVNAMEVGGGYVVIGDYSDQIGVWWHLTVLYGGSGAPSLSETDFVVVDADVHPFSAWRGATWSLVHPDRRIVGSVGGVSSFQEAPHVDRRGSMVGWAMRYTLPENLRGKQRSKRARFHERPT